MSTMRKSNDQEVIAILLADIHLSLKPPIWRSAEPDWFEAMKRPLDEVKRLQKQYDNCPVLCAGDIFNLWNSPPELINFAAEALPQMYAIPGQHDLPLHRYEDIKKSAYYSLIKMDVIQNILPGCSIRLGKFDGGFELNGFPYGYDIEVKRAQTNRLSVAMAHQYVWIKGFSYPNAPMHENLAGRTTKFSNSKILGYDVIVYGDNHKGFSGLGVGKCNVKTEIFNCGSLIRRSIDEVSYNPQVGLLLQSGEVKRHYLDITSDKYLAILNTVNTKTEMELQEVIKSLELLGTTSLNFSEAIKQATSKVDSKVREIILKAMEQQ